jgi:Fe-S-cluster containining protein
MIEQTLKICQYCKAKCCNLGGADVTGAERETIIKAGYPDHFLKIGSNHYEMLSKNGRCPYLKKDNTCSIHRLRPLPCRCFPVHPEFIEGKKKYLLALCPLANKLPDEIIRNMKKNSAKIKNYIIKDRFLDTNLSKSEINIILRKMNKFKIKVLD